jgi:hypothetical protein
MFTMPETQLLVTLGVDTHAEIHVVAALDHLGRELGTPKHRDHGGGLP